MDYFYYTVRVPCNFVAYIDMYGYALITVGVGGASALSAVGSVVVEALSFGCGL